MINVPDLGKLDLNLVIDLLAAARDTSTSPQLIDDQLKGLAALKDLLAGKQGMMDDTIYIVSLLIKAGDEMVQLQRRIDELTSEK